MMKTLPGQFAAVRGDLVFDRGYGGCRRRRPGGIEDIKMLTNRLLLLRVSRYGSACHAAINAAMQNILGIFEPAAVLGRLLQEKR